MITVKGHTALFATLSVVLCLSSLIRCDETKLLQSNDEKNIFKFLRSLLEGNEGSPDEQLNGPKEPMRDEAKVRDKRSFDGYNFNAPTQFQRHLFRPMGYAPGPFFQTHHSHSMHYSRNGPGENDSPAVIEDGIPPVGSDNVIPLPAIVPPEMPAPGIVPPEMPAPGMPAPGMPAPGMVPPQVPPPAMAPLDIAQPDIPPAALPNTMDPWVNILNIFQNNPFSNLFPTIPRPNVTLSARKQEIKPFLVEFFHHPIFGQDPLKYMLSFQKMFLEKVCPTVSSRVYDLCDLYCHPLVMCARLCDPACPQYENPLTNCLFDSQNVTCSIFCMDVLRCSGACSPNCPQYRDLSDCPHWVAPDEDTDSTAVSSSSTASDSSTTEQGETTQRSRKSAKRPNRG